MKKYVKFNVIFTASKDTILSFNEFTLSYAISAHLPSTILSLLLT